MAFAALLIAFLPRPARSEPAFGDSTWVAPGWENAAWYKASCDTCTYGADSPGPRVAAKDKDPLGETILRAPFRLLFLPFRFIARGSEAAVAIVGKGLAPAPTHKPKPKWSFQPIVTPDPSFGLGFTRRLDAQGDAKLVFTGIYGIQDRRRARLVYDLDKGIYGWTFQAGYHFRPNVTFYGTGNDSHLGNKSFWLREEGTISGVARYGHAIRHEIRALGSISQVSARRGYSGPANAERTELVFTPEEAPFLERGSRVYSFGLAGDYALLDDIRTPHRGIHLKGEAEQLGSIDESHLDYRHFHFEARGYVPLFSDRRVLAVRAVHDWIDPSQDSEAIPYYRLPETNDELRFNGYQTHRFSDRHVVLGTVEYRWWITNKLYALLNATVGEVASQNSRLRWDAHHEAYGTGFRYGYSDRLSARADFAKGSEGLAINLTLEDTF